MASAKRQRRYIAPHWLLLAKPFLRYSSTRDAFVLRAIGNSRGPVLRVDRRSGRRQAFEGIERRGGHLA
jgi:hypothetical protein